jgi:23S rRNA pseudouridine2605 synthase
MKTRKLNQIMMRLNKYIAESGICSRRKAEEFIVQGRVSVNSSIITDLSFSVDTENDEVMLDGEKIKIRRHTYYLLNKPGGIVTTTNDEKNRRTVIDLIKTNERIYPVGRLDYDTTGVLFLTNDGEFSQVLTHPANKVPREYELKLSKALTKDDQQKLLKGIYLKGIKGKFIKLSFLKKNDFTHVKITAVEGRNHFVKNMFGALGYNVISLNRLSYAGIKADIEKGKYRRMTQAEIQNIMQKYGN